MYELAYQEEGNEQIVPIRAEGIVLGRSPDCDVVIKDFGVSRRHAEVVLNGGECRVVDLKSKNGTQVNGVRVPEAALKDGDEILLGKFRVLFRKTLEEKVVLDEEKPLLEEAGTVIRSVGELSKFFLEEKPNKDPTKPREIRPESDEPSDELCEDQPRSPQSFGARTGTHLRPARGSPAPGHGRRVRAHPGGSGIPDAV